MPKLKTHKALAKRIKITRNKKMIARSKGQDHFNSRASGKKTRNKRRNKNVSKSLSKNIKKFI